MELRNVLSLFSSWSWHKSAQLKRGVQKPGRAMSLLTVVEYVEVVRIYFLVRKEKCYLLSTVLVDSLAVRVVVGYVCLCACCHSTCLDHRR